MMLPPKIQFINFCFNPGVNTAFIFLGKNPFCARKWTLFWSELTKLLHFFLKGLSLRLSYSSILKSLYHLELIYFKDLFICWKGCRDRRIWERERGRDISPTGSLPRWLCCPWLGQAGAGSLPSQAHWQGAGWEVGTHTGCLNMLYHSSRGVRSWGGSAWDAPVCVVWRDLPPVTE